jgi:excinuclease ABC subunit A
VCAGKRYNRETLEILYKGLNIAQVLQLTVEDANTFFSAVPNIARKLQTLLDVGLGYIRLGQAATTLSGGEAQRVKLALELSKRDTGRTLYILDEPTTGLHFHDIQLLLKVLHQLREAGNTIVVIEHNLDVIKTADWLIDLGPEGGAGGGRVLMAGTPEQMAASGLGHTAGYLAPLLADSLDGSLATPQVALPTVKG